LKLTSKIKKDPKKKKFWATTSTPPELLHFGTNRTGAEQEQARISPTRSAVK
jgi:hypothetical protein